MTHQHVISFSWMQDMRYLTSLKEALALKLPWAWEYTKSIKKRWKNCHQVMGPGTETWLYDSFSTRLGPKLEYKIGRG